MPIPIELAKVIDLVGKHNRWRRFECINLIPSENIMSPLAEAVYLSDLMHRYAEGEPGKRFYQGNIYSDQIELYTSQLLYKLFSIRFVEPRPISGTIANAIAFRSFAEPGDRAVVPSIQAGAHISHTKLGILGAMGIKQFAMPFDIDRWNIDVDRAGKVIENVKPRLVILGASVYLFPHPTREIACVAHSVNSMVIHDVAHVLGLIAGKSWPNPIYEGADIATASTHKTFPGPQGGVIFMDNRDIYEAVSRNVLRFVSNHHLHRLPATAITAIEMLYFGEQYSRQIIRNAKMFAEALAEQGLKVVAEDLGYTQSHMVLIDVGKCGGGAKIVKMLEEANIIANKNLLPWDSPGDAYNPSGIRFGVQEMTRFGMKEDDFKEIAVFIREIILDRKDVYEVRKNVLEFRKNFINIAYGFDIPRELYNNVISIPMIL